MDFQKKDWQFRDIISESELNRIEDGIEEGITKAEQAEQVAEQAQQTANSHASRHASGGADPLTPEMIGAFRRYSARIDDADFDEIISHGVYAIGSNPQHAPSGVAGFGVLLVVNSFNDRYCQIYFSIGNGRTYIRYGTTAPPVTWGEWRELMPSNGGTMTGDLTISKGFPYINLTNTSTGAGTTSIAQSVSGGVPELRIGKDVENVSNAAVRITHNDVMILKNTPYIGPDQAWHAGNLPVESGNWTVTIEGLTTPGSPSYYYRAGYYYRIGKLVYVFFVAALTNKGGVAGQVRVRGLPFPVASTSPAYSFQGLSIARVVGVNFPANAVDFMASFAQGGSDIFFQFALSNGGDAVAVDDTHIGNFFEVRASGVYLTV
jgi:hypothetical protein